MAVMERDLEKMQTPKKRQKTVFGQEVYSAFISGEYPKGKNYSNETVFFEGDTIYSYGYHFPMAIKMNGFYLVNADVYSNTTSKHQSNLRSALKYHDTVLIPFSALESAGIWKDTIVALDREDEKEIPYEYKDRTTGETRVGHMHLMGSTLFKATRIDTRNDVSGEFYFLSGLDETGSNPWSAFFLAQLPGEVFTVETAYRMLKPQPVLAAEIMDKKEVLRQGEWFFIPVDDGHNDILNQFEKDGLAKGKGEYAFLENRDRRRGGSHIATRLIDYSGEVYVRGTVRHIGGDHKMLKLEPKRWYRAYENTQVAGWGSQGRID